MPCRLPGGLRPLEERRERLRRDRRDRCVQGQPGTCALHRDFHGPQGCHIRAHHTLHHIEGPEEPATRALETDCGTRERSRRLTPHHRLTQGARD
ncbi:hypothetical protein NDU88_006923 [Pleurodeles waltl]|uniref:Uncharacterized protein n=1 Tax=Pleurodeles waltl TaxID=8319 RepID=A0AAV7RMY2_PLEWA|nr:hypothetical protein NDU88_006923 [Pleurodeles waltl]